MSLKMYIVSEIQRGILSTTHARKQYGIQARSTVIQYFIKCGKSDWKN